MQIRTGQFLALAGLGLAVAQPGWAQTAAEVSRVDSADQQAAEYPFDSLRHDARPYIAPMLSAAWLDDSNEAGLDDTLGGAISIGKPFTAYFTGEVFVDFAGDASIEGAVFDNVNIFQYGLSALVFPLPHRLPVYGLASYGLSQFDFDRVGGLGDEPSETGTFWDVGAGARLALTDIGIPDPWGVSLRAEYRYRQADVNVELGSKSTADEFDIDGHLFQIGLQIPILPPSD
tara:strand:+ start:175 stop:867 length:693 start_codon:yes stop_codon:yes gene_type:complete